MNNTFSRSKSWNRQREVGVGSLHRRAEHARRQQRRIGEARAAQVVGDDLRRDVDGEVGRRRLGLAALEALTELGVLLLEHLVLEVEELGPGAAQERQKDESDHGRMVVRLPRRRGAAVK
jgi:hypothetical protein